MRIRSTAVILALFVLGAPGSSGSLAAEHGAEGESRVKIIPGGQLSAAQRVTQAAAFLELLEGDLRAVMILLEYAREDRQAIRIACVLEKIERLAPRVTEVRKAYALLHAGGLSDAESRATYDSMLPVVSAAATLRGEAEACVGELSAYAALETVFEVDAVGEPTDEMAFLAEPVEIQFRPPAASPYQLRARKAR